MTRAAALSKHRLASDSFAVDFTARLADGESLTGPPTVTVAQRSGAEWIDFTPEFAVADEAVVGATAAFTLGAAAPASDEQNGGDYYVRVEIDTSNGQHLVSTHPLEVRETADPSAP